MDIKKSTEILEQHPILLLYPFLSVSAAILLFWFFPYIAILKFIMNDWLSFVPAVVKAVFFVLSFTLSFLYVFAFFGSSLTAAAVLRIQGKSYSIFDGCIEVLKSFKYFVAWVLFDFIVYPIVNIFMEKFQQLPNEINAGGDIVELASTKLREFATPIVIFEKLMPHNAVQRALELTIAKGAASLLGDLGWGVIILALFAFGFIVPVSFSAFYGLQDFGGYGFSIVLSYFAIVWVFSIVNNAIRIAQIYAQEVS